MRPKHPLPLKPCNRAAADTLPELSQEGAFAHSRVPSQGADLEHSNDKVFVVYCAGPHCNGANKAAVPLARLGLPVKIMIGGVTGWINEGFTLIQS